MFTAITSFFQSLTKAIEAYETHIIEQDSIEVLKSKKRLKKASDITEEILTIVDKYVESFDTSDSKRYQKLKKAFQKVN